MFIHRTEIYTTNTNLELSSPNTDIVLVLLELLYHCADFSLLSQVIHPYKLFLLVKVWSNKYYPKVHSLYGFLSHLHTNAPKRKVKVKMCHTALALRTCRHAQE